MHTKYLNRMVYDHLLKVDKNLAKEFKKEANVSGKLEAGSPTIVDVVRHFKETATKEKRIKLVVDENFSKKRDKTVKKDETLSKTDCKFSDLLRESNIEGLENSKISKVVQMIKDEIGMGNLKSISNHDFLQRARDIIENDLQNSDPFCRYCLKTFENRINRNFHVKVIHEEQKYKKFSCKICNKHFMSKVAKNYHKDVCHSKSSTEIECEVCGELLGHTISLKRHMKKHEKEPKEYECPECEKVFKRKDSLQKHKRIVHRF